MNQLASQEINTLIEALQYWEKEPGNRAFEKSMMSAVLTASMTHGDEVAMNKVKLEGDKRISLAETEGIVRREISVIIQAKLLQMRNEVLKEELTESNA